MSGALQQINAGRDLVVAATPVTTRCAQEEIRIILDRCEGAYAENTLRGYRSDLAAFAAWCDQHGRRWLPADASSLADFIDDVAGELTSATVRRRVAAIQFAHMVADLPSPVGASRVRLALRRAARRGERRPVQSQGLTSAILKEIIAAQPPTLAGLRDVALISVGYDTLCRSCELAAMRVEHLRMALDAWSVVIPRSKADREGEGRLAWLSPSTAERLGEWLNASGVKAGPVFRGLHTGRLGEGALSTSSIRRLIKRAAHRTGIEASCAAALSGHSMRVGAAQDMMLVGFDTTAILQAGGWKTPAVLLRYVEHAKTQALHEHRWSTLNGLGKLELKPTQYSR
jgi:integrase/recombinase XerD